MIRFHSYYTIKDLVGVYLFLCLLMFVVLFFPDLFKDPSNFSPANYIKTPEHIKPEWYFLFAYAILRSVPSKVGGVIGIVYSVLVLCGLPWLFCRKGQALV